MKIMRPWGCVGGALKNLRDDRSGISLIYVTIALPVIIGFALLAIDVSRVWSLQSSLQHAADSLALAAAGELDRRPDAITRAERVINDSVANNSMVINSALFGSVTTIDKNEVTARYLSALPASDAAPILPSDYLSTASADLAESSMEAGFVEIIVKPVSITSLFPASFLGALNAKLVNATAVAGFTAAVCKFTPMWICNPYECSSNSGDPNYDPNCKDTITESPELFAALADPAERKRLIQMHNVGGAGATPFPGNFGFLEPPDSPGANAIRDMLAQVSPPACFNANGVNLETGAVVSARFGLNVRFDMYDGPMNSNKNDPNYRPSLNVRKGYNATPKCNPSPSADGSAMAMPLDNCFLDSPPTCTFAGGHVGNGNWDKQAYWDTNYSNSYGLTLPAALQGANVSRYDFYRYMIDQQTSGGPAYLDHQSPPTAGETGTPQCYNGGGLSDTPDRRIFYAAALNCMHLNTDPHYGPITGSSSPYPLPVVAFLKMFITRPVGCNGSNCKTQDNTANSDKPVYAEMTGVVKPGTGGNDVTRDQVQLYR